MVGSASGGRNMGGGSKGSRGEGEALPAAGLEGVSGIFGATQVSVPRGS